MMKLKAIVLMVLLGLLPAKVSNAGEIYNLEEIGVSYGRGIDVTQWVQIDIIQHVAPPLYFLEEWLREPFLDVGMSQSKWTQTGDIAYHLSANLLIRSQDIPSALGKFFFEAGFGPHLFSRPGQTNRLDTAFEFNSVVGVGLKLNPAWSLIARARHLSNAGITEPNAGVNLYLLQLHYRFNQP